jgi:hypothetical protein
MAQVVISGDSSGSITLAAPSASGTTTLTLPATTGTVLNDATCGVCRAWVNFNGVTTATIRASYNVSSVTRNSSGDYTINFTTALSDANYAATFGVRNDGAGSGANFAVVVKQTTTPTASAINIVCGAPSLGTATDSAYIYASFFR